MSGPPVDVEIREEALDTRRSFILEAPAGSGKTALLTARYLALLAEVAHPRQILAVTFTRKAAAEMADRIARALREARAGVEPPADRPWDARLLALAKRATEAHAGREEVLRDPHSFLVQTFHGFCASVARGWPLESGVAPGLDLLEEDEQRELLGAAVAEALEAAARGRAEPEVCAAVRRRLAAANNSLRELSGQMADILQRRDRLPDFSRLLAGRGGGALGATLEERAARCAALFMGRPASWFGERAAAWSALSEGLKACPGGLAEAFPASVPGTGLADVGSWKAAAAVFLTSGGTARRAFQARSGFSKGFGSTASADFIRSLPDDVAREMALIAKWPEPAEDNVGLAALADMLLLAAEVSARLRRLHDSRGLDYLELEVAALRALGGSDSPSTGLVFFHEHLQHLLVDEAQDVNDTQVRILGALAEGWEPGGGRTLFVVGDPKQSIYRFRRAEVSLFEALRDGGLPRAGEPPFTLRPLQLEANFRSRPKLVEFANALFERVMASPDKAFDEVDFKPSAPTRPREGAASAVRAAFFSFRAPQSREPEHPLAAEAREREARWVASSVAAIHRGEPSATVGILIPARTHLAPFVVALEDFGVPVRLLEGRPMLDQPEVRHLMNLFRALVRPYDDLAWAGVLRSPWCRVGDGTLERLAGLADAGPWRARVLRSPDAEPELSRFRAAFEGPAGAFGREPFHETLQRLWERLDGPRRIARARGPQGVTNAMAFLDRLAGCEGLSGEEALSRLERVLEEAYTPPDPRGAFSPVSLMTIHRAKGLEFDHVFAVALDYDSRRHRGADPPAFLMDRVPGPERLPLAASTADRRTGEESLAHALLVELEKRRRLAEYRRQFYVAVTRARESLSLTGLFARRSDPDEEGRAPSAINWVWRALRDGSLEGLAAGEFPGPAPPAEAPSPPGGRRPAPVVPPFDPVPLPYVITSPSRVEDETAVAAAPGAEESDPFARAKGSVFHRAFERLLRGGALPPARAVAAALASEGLPADAAGGAAAELVEEVGRAWQCTAFRELRGAAEESLVEWAVEDYDGARVLRVGRIDLLLRTASGWAVVDYKTGRPDADVEAWVRRESARYAPQLRAYAEMAARALGTAAGVRTALLLTALPRLVWVTGEDEVQDKTAE